MKKDKKNQQKPAPAFEKVNKKLKDDPKKRAEWFRKRRGTDGPKPKHS